MINKQNTTRFSPGSAGGAPRAVDLTQAGRPSVSADAMQDQIPAIWEMARALLRRRLGDVKFDSWLSGLELVAEVNGEILVSAASEHERARVEADYGHFIQQAWEQADRNGRRVRIEARERISNEVMALARVDNAAAAPRNEDAFDEETGEFGSPAGGSGGSDEEAPTLENFMVGDSNRVAFGLARRLAMGAGVSANVVTIVGPHGVGKSHLLKGIEAALRSTRGEGSVLYMSSEDFTVAFVDGVKRKDTSDLRTLVRRILANEGATAPQLVASDVQSLLEGYDWPGNLRQLASVLHTAAVMAAGEAAITREHLSDDFLDEASQRQVAGNQAAANEPAPGHPTLPGASGGTLEELEREMIRQAVDAADGNISVASKRLGISRNTIYRKLRWRTAA